MSNEYLSDMVMPELLKSESSMVSEPPSPEVTVGNTSGTGVSSLPNSERMVLSEEQWNELFGESKERKHHVKELKLLVEETTW